MVLVGVGGLGGVGEVGWSLLGFLLLGELLNYN